MTNATTPALTIQEFAAKFEAAQRARLIEDGINEDIIVGHYSVNVRAGKKYTKVDIGTSGRFMIDAEGNIFGIKGYGKIHLGHHFGTLSTTELYHWGEYYPIKK